MGVSFQETTVNTYVFEQLSDALLPHSQYAVSLQPLLQ
jgi:hypothetical protein